MALQIMILREELELNIIIGLDIGGSTTKIIGLNGQDLIGMILVRASDPVASAYGAFGRFISDHNLDLSDISRVMVTGVGSSYLKSPLLGINTIRLPEFMAIGLGGLFVSGLPEAVVVSMGTGTAVVRAVQAA